jgi:hypothetical protein
MHPAVIWLRWYCKGHSFVCQCRGFLNVYRANNTVCGSIETTLPMEHKIKTWQRERKREKMEVRECSILQAVGRNIHNTWTNNVGKRRIDCLTLNAISISTSLLKNILSLSHGDNKNIFETLTSSADRHCYCSTGRFLRLMSNRLNSRLVNFSFSIHTNHTVCVF